jgi:hypothetical protein
MPQVECVGEIHYCPARDNALTMDGSASQEGRLTLVGPVASFTVPVPIPPGVNTLHTLRADAYAIDSAASAGEVFVELACGRDSAGNVWQASFAVVAGGLTFGPLISVQPGGLSVDYNGPGPGVSQSYAWRWTLSPAYAVPFAISSPP